MKYEKPDGVIEPTFSACCCPPGEKRKGMHTNSCTFWWRVNNGAWVQHRGDSGTRILAGAANTCAEFEQAMKEGA